MLSSEELKRLKSIHPHALADKLGLPFQPTVRGGMLPAIWRGEKHNSVSYLQSAQGHWYWTDFGTGEGGSHIDLIMKQFGLNYTQAIYRLRNIFNEDIPATSPINFSFPLPFSKPSTLSWDIKSMRPCGVRDLYVLVTQRHLDPHNIPLNNLKWLTISHPYKKFSRQCYGIKNSSGGHELFSGYSSSHALSFKSCCGSKDISVFNMNTRDWVVSESLIDAMSVQKIVDHSMLSIISLNGVGQIDRAGAFLAKYHSRIGRLIIALDHDSAGQIAQDKMVKFCECLKISFEILNYSGKDPNDALKNSSVCRK
jgi:hypothetical protein